MKFPTEVGIRKVCSEQVLYRECYVQELKVREKDVKMAKLQAVGDPLFPKIMVHEVET